MAWYHGKFSCGCEGRVNAVGPIKHRQWKIDRAFEKMCEVCYNKHLQEERDRANREAEKQAKEMDLPILTGSEKQVAWANTLRQKLIDNFTELAEKEVADKEKILTIMYYIIENRTDSKYFIDNRYDTVKDCIEREVNNAIKTDEQIIEEKRIADLEAEALVVPDNAVTTTVAEINLTENVVVVMFERNDTFRNLVKELGYSWDRGWRKSITTTTGTATERMAELGSRLLAEGFPVRIYDKMAREKAINADYEPEQTKWITFRASGEYKGRLAIRWRGRNDRLYSTARKIPTSRWSNGAVVVKIDKYEDVEEFARLYDFDFTEGAMEAIEEYKKVFSSSIVTPEAPNMAEDKDGLQEILESSTEILDDLRDD